MKCIYDSSKRRRRKRRRSFLPFHSSTVCSRSSSCLSVIAGGGWKNTQTHVFSISVSTDGSSNHRTIRPQAITRRDTQEKRFLDSKYRNIQLKARSNESEFISMKISDDSILKQTHPSLFVFTPGTKLSQS